MWACYIYAPYSQRLQTSNGVGKVGAANAKGYIDCFDAAESESPVPENRAQRMAYRVADNGKNLAGAGYLEVCAI